jgi:hypothetical protein
MYTCQLRFRDSENKERGRYLRRGAEKFCCSNHRHGIEGRVSGKRGQHRKKVSTPPYHRPFSFLAFLDRLVTKIPVRPSAWDVNAFRDTSLINFEDFSDGELVQIRPYLHSEMEFGGVIEPLQSSQDRDGESSGDDFGPAKDEAELADQSNDDSNSCANGRLLL